jgi:hypothetical protein
MEFLSIVALAALIFGIVKQLGKKNYRLKNVGKGVTYMETREDGLSLWGRKI